MKSGWYVNQYLKLSLINCINKKQQKITNVNPIAKKIITLTQLAILSI